MDIFSRKVVAWGIYDKELAILAQNLISVAVEREKIDPNVLTIHSDRGAPMRSKMVSELLSDLCIEKSFSRPYVSNDNPYSEAAFKTLKYVPNFPERFGCLQDTKVFFNRLFKWYNQDHKHSGIGYFSPNEVHTGADKKLKIVRDATLVKAWKAHPERFVNGKPEAKMAPATVWINKPEGGVKCLSD